MALICFLPFENSTLLEAWKGLGQIKWAYTVDGLLQIKPQPALAGLPLC